MRVANQDLIPGGPESMSADIELPAVWLGHIANFSIQLFFSGGVNGTWKLQASNDVGIVNQGSNYVPSSVVNWTDIADSSQAITSAGDIMWQFENAGFNWVRAVYSNNAGAGQLDVARAYVKGV